MTKINADLFNKAADEIERRGLNKGSLTEYQVYEEDPANCKVCFWGGINAAYNDDGDPGEFPESDDDRALMEIVRNYTPFSELGFRPGVHFNDHSDTTKEDVVAKLREIAASLT